MRPPRFTIAGLLGLVLWLGVGLAAFLQSTNALDFALFGVILALLLVSTLLAVHREGPRRAYWFGFALFGWAYVTASLNPTVEPRLPTTRGLIFLETRRPNRPIGASLASLLADSFRVASIQASDPTAIVPPPPPNLMMKTATGYSMIGPAQSTEDFIRIGHSLLAVVFAMIGALLSRALSASKRPEPPRATVSQGGGF